MSVVEIIPRNDRVLLESLPDEVRGANVEIERRIIVPYQAAEPSRLAKVLAIGPKVVSVKVHDVVLCQRYGGAESKDAKMNRYFFMKEDEILCRVT